MNSNIFKDSYSYLPYHNRYHSERVHAAISRIRDDKIFRISALGHDLLHTGTPLPGDEKRAARETIILACEAGLLYSRLEIKKVEHLILWTIFTERNNLSFDQQLLADADLYAIGDDFNSYTTEAAKLFIENCLALKKMSPTRQEILNFWNIGQDSFFSYLTGITGHEDKPYLTDIANKKFHNFPKNYEKLRYIREKNPEMLIKIVQREWKNFFKKPLHVL